MTEDTSLSHLIRIRDGRIICTGGVVFIGDGNAGKTHTAINITNYKHGAFYNSEDETVKKSFNLELNYFILHSNIEEYQLTTSSQIFIMPGQKGRAGPGEGLAFEDAVDMFHKITSIDVVVALVLTFDLTDLYTFQELEYWLDRAIERNMIKNYTNIIILGTHLDHIHNVEVNDEMLQDARSYIQSYLLEKIGLNIDISNIHMIKISNITGEGINELKQAINNSFISAFKIQDIFKKPPF